MERDAGAAARDPTDGRVGGRTATTGERPTAAEPEDLVASAERSFLERIDARFPHGDRAQPAARIEEASRISDEAIAGVVQELVISPVSRRPAVELRNSLLDRVEELTTSPMVKRMVALGREFVRDPGSIRRDELEAAMDLQLAYFEMLAHLGGEADADPRWPGGPARRMARGRRRRWDLGLTESCRW